MKKQLFNFKFIIALVLISFFLLGTGAGYYVYWGALFIALGIIFLPLTDLVFGRFKNRGYMFSKVIAVAVAGYIQWLISSFHLVPFTWWSVYLILLLCLGGNLLINKKTKTFQKYWNDQELFTRVVNMDSLFMLFLLIWTIIRAMRPEINGIEKFMDFGFINACLRSPYFPPQDIWLANHSVNYYYLGYYFVSFVIRVSQIDSAISYNLWAATLFALPFMLAYSIGDILIETYQAHAGTRKLHKHAGKAAGILIGALICLSGTLHTVLYPLLYENATEYSSYWFPDATRYIGYSPEVANDKTIHEFPSYALVIADLHPHVINMIFVLTVIGLALALAIRLSSRNEEENEKSPPIWKDVGYWLMVFIVGLFPGSNFWDYPIYTVFTSVMLFYVFIKRYGFTAKTFYQTAGYTALTGIAAYIIALPFTLNFDSMGTVVRLVSHRSLLYQLGVLWGYQVAFFAFLLAVMIIYHKQDTRKIKNIKSKFSNTLLNFITKANPADILVLMTFICAIGLFIIPEIIYIQDIYPTHPRSNTMFKLGYQAFMMFSIGIGYTFFRSLFHAGKKFDFQYVAGGIGALLLIFAFMYPFFSIRSWYTDPFSNKNASLELNGTKYMLTMTENLLGTADTPHVATLVDDYEVIQYIKKNIHGEGVIAEAAGSAYSSYGRISANTGLSDIMNWYTHEQLWRNSNTALLDARSDDVKALFTAQDTSSAREIIDRHGVDYIIIGKVERITFGDNLSEDILLEMGDTIFTLNDTRLIRVR